MKVASVSTVFFAIVIAMAFAMIVGGCASPMPDRYPEQSPDEVLDRGDENMSAAGRSLLIQSRSERQSGNYAQASATLERAIRIEPDHAAIWLELARIRLLEGNYAQAEQLGRKARSLAAGNRAIETQSAVVIDEALSVQRKRDPQ